MILAALLAVTLVADRAPAEACAPSPAQAAPVIEFSPSGAGADRAAKIMVSASLMLSMAKADAGHVRDAGEPCRLANFQAGGATWALEGGDRAFVRRAVSPDRRRPVAFLYPVSDMVALLDAQRTHAAPPPIEYVLVTSQGATDFIWKAYEALPSDAQLTADLTSALGGQVSAPISVDVNSRQVTVSAPQKPR